MPPPTSCPECGHGNVVELGMTSKAGRVRREAAAEH